jgi:hypothetical protein
MKKYVIKCKKCNKQFYSETSKRQLCYHCRKKKRKKIPAIFNRELKHQVYERDKFVCIVCDKDLTNENKNPKVVFLDGNHNHTKLSNLAIMCDKCLRNYKKQRIMTTIHAKIKENERKLRNQPKKEVKPILPHLNELLARVDKNIEKLV